MGLRTNHSNIGLESYLNQGQILYLKAEEYVDERTLDSKEERLLILC